MKILIIQTAFLGDVILSLPIVQVIKNSIPDVTVDYMCIPKTKDILQNNPYISKVIVFDKHEENKGLIGLNKITAEVKSNRYDVVVLLRVLTNIVFYTFMLNFLVFLLKFSACA